MGAEQRAEDHRRFTATSIIPRELRSPVFAARLFLAVLAMSAGAKASQVAAGSDPDCRVGVRVVSYTYFDMAQVVPGMGRRHILDMGIDPRAGAAAGFVVDAVPIDYKAGDRNKAGFRPLGSTNIIRNPTTDAGEGVMEFIASCNTTAVTSDGDRRPALGYKVVSNLDPNNDQFEVVTPDGRRSVVAFGSEIKKREDFLALVNAGIQEIKDLGDKKKALIVESVSVQTPIAVITPVAERTQNAEVAPVGTAVPETPTPTIPDTRSEPESEPETGDGVLKKALNAVGVVEIGIGVAGWLLAAGLLLNLPRRRLQAIRLNRPRTRLWNTIAFPLREIRYRLGPRRAYNRGLANGTIPGGTPAPARGYQGIWGV